MEQSVRVQIPPRAPFLLLSPFIFVNLGNFSFHEYITDCIDMHVLGGYTDVHESHN